MRVTQTNSGTTGDANGDGTVDCADKPYILAAIGTDINDAAYDIRADLDLDGDVDAADLNAFYALVPACLRCQPADIAYDDGTPLPPVGPLPTTLNGLTNTGVNEGDYNAFFNGFSNGNPECDIANDDGSPLPPFGTLTSNGGVNEGDYNLFFNTFFDGCP
ncbi:hypothetical protein BH11PLA1_BH11PLA1_13130 [soil metagenome]